MRLQSFLLKPNKSKPLLLRQIYGPSMLPVLAPGRIVLATCWFRKIQEGQVVIIFHEGLEKIKRVGAIQNGAVYVIGDNEEASTDSRQFGWLPIEAVVARVLFPRAGSSHH
jgi:phage repressor protein C with HTH and peptisase S24 domain